VYELAVWIVVFFSWVEDCVVFSVFSVFFSVVVMAFVS
jgi:hypothetical protein